MGIKCFLLDMDGVIADFVSRSLMVADIPLTHDEVTEWSYFEKYMTQGEFWNHIERDADFWNQLNEYGWSTDLYQSLAVTSTVVFCSTPSRDANAASQKIEWLRSHGYMGQNENRYFLVGHAPSKDGSKFGKNMLACPETVLIDDSDVNIRDFIESGGHGILFPQPWNENRDKVADRLGYVQAEIARIHNEIELSKWRNVAPRENPKDAIGFTKPPIHTVPPYVLLEIAMGMFEGAWKYQSYNYRKIGIRYSRYYDAAIRHLMAWWEGEDIDTASGLSHISKALSCLVVLRDAMMQSDNGGTPIVDDRPPKNLVSMDTMAVQFREMLNRLESEHGPMKPPYTHIETE